MFTIRRIAIAFGGVFVAVGSIELLLRLAWPQVYPDHPQYMLSPDPFTGHVLTPGFHGKFERSEFSVDMMFNKQGLRGSPRSPKKTGTVRIVCIGDSLTWGWGVEAQQTYCHLLRELLGAQFTGAEFQTVNAGIPYYGTKDELAYFRQYGDLLQPDYVVHLFNAANDFQQNQLGAAERYLYRDGFLLPNRQFVADTSPPWLPPLETLKHRSHAVKFFSENAGYLLMRFGVAASRDEASNELVSVTVGLLDELRAAANAVDARMVFVLAPEKSRILGGVTSTPADAAAIITAAEVAGDIAIDLGPLLLAQADRESLYGRYEGFWTADAHRLVASALADALSASFAELPARSAAE